MLKGMSVMHPAAKMLVDLSAAQDVEAGDGTTSVVVIAGSLLGAADRLLSKGMLFPLLVLMLKTYSLKAYILPLSQSPSKELRQRQWKHLLGCLIQSHYQTELHFSKQHRHPYLLRLFHNTQTCWAPWLWMQF